MYNKVELCGMNTAKLPVLTEAEKRELLARAHAGDAAAREQMVEGNLRLVLSVVQRFAQRGENLDDLFQVGCIGLIKAIDHFDPAQPVRFSTYGVPMIVGEIRRYLRDNSAIRVSRSLRDTAYKVLQARERLLRQSQREPTVEQLAQELCALNRERQAVEQEIYSQAVEQIEETPPQERSALVLASDTWHQGVVGIVASRLIETYYRPTEVLTMSNGFVTGSARSVPGFDLYQAIESCSDLLENFGGHMYAAGLTMRPERVEEFTRRFNAYVEENIDPITLQPQVEIDSELFFSNITPAFRRDLNRFQPFGPGNPAPVFVTRGVVSHGETKLVGADCEHLRMDLMQRQKPNTTIQTIAFQQPTHYEWIRAGHPIDVCYQIVENHYRGSVSVQLRIKDIKPLRSKQ